MQFRGKGRTIYIRGYIFWSFEMRNLDSTQSSWQLIPFSVSNTKTEHILWQPFPFLICMDGIRTQKFCVRTKGKDTNQIKCKWIWENEKKEGKRFRLQKSFSLSLFCGISIKSSRTTVIISTKVPLFSCVYGVITGGRLITGMKGASGVKNGIHFAFALFSNGKDVIQFFFCLLIFLGEVLWPRSTFSEWYTGWLMSLPDFRCEKTTIGGKQELIVKTVPECRRSVSWNRFRVPPLSYLPPAIAALCIRDWGNNPNRILMWHGAEPVSRWLLSQRQEKNRSGNLGNATFDDFWKKQ